MSALRQEVKDHSMSGATGQEYLREQYKDASNLTARIGLHARFSTNPLGFHRWVFDLFKLPPRSRILEVGCGPGALWASNRDHIPSGWDLALTDFSPGMVEQARQNLAGTQCDFVYASTDAQALPFQGDAFDAAIANHMLYHVADRTKALSEIKRVLTQGGRLYASTFGKQHMQEMSELMHRFNPSAPLLWESLTDSFIIENGQEQLASYFTNITFHRYENTLIVTEAAPLVAYVRSMAIGTYFDGERFTRFVEQELAERGPISIRSDTGLFEAAKA
jgi:ubiquinone/menaquinone biosynthesis C-methylase UbiE